MERIKRKKYVGLRSVLVLLFIIFGIFNGWTQNVPPVLSNFRIENNNKSRVYFDSSEPISGSSTKGFKVTGEKVSGISIKSGSKKGHYISISGSFDFWDNNTIRYEGSRDIKSSNGVALSEFTLEYIKNNIPEPKGRGNIFYVSTKGHDKNSGLSPGKSWRSISHAATKAKEGDIVYIKAGDYGDDRVIVRGNGSSTNPIKFIGYRNTIGDRPVLNRNQDTKLDSKIMPLIHSGGNSGTGFSAGKKAYIIVKNIQLEGYEDAIDFVEAKNGLLENIYVKGSSRFNIVASKSTSSKFIGCYSANAGNSGIRYSGARTLIDDMYVSSRGNPNMDYLISLYGSDDGIGSIILNSKIVADPKDSHSQHGLSIKADDKKLEYVLCENIYIQDVEQPIEVRHHEVSYSVFRSIQCMQVHATASERSAGIVLLNGPHHNTFDNITVDGNYASIWFASSSEDKESPDTAHDNIIMNSTFRNGQYIIRMAEDNYNLSRPLYNNYIINCTFYNHDKLYWNEHPKSRDNHFVNCVFDGIEKEKVEPKGANPGWDIKYSASWNISWLKNGKSFPGEGNISENPKFEDASRGNFRLKSTSKLIDAGRKESKVINDFDGNPRPQGSSHDIGAFEYQNSKTSSVKANAGEDQEICLGEEAILTADGGTEYTWSNGETSKEIKVRPTETTTYSVIVGNGIDKDKDEVIVTVDQVIANAGPDAKILVGESIKLNATGGESYLWSNGETNSSITVSPEKTTIYTVIVYYNGCDAIDEVKIIVETPDSNPPPAEANAGEDQTICLGESITLNASGGITYLWDTGEISDKIIVNPSRTTTYELKATRGGVTDIDTVTIVVENCSVSSNEEIIEDFDIHVYPNPTTGLLKLQSNTTYSDLDVQLIDINGKVLLQDRIKSNQDILSSQLDLSNYTKGIYFVRFFNPNQNTVKKIVII